MPSSDSESDSDSDPISLEKGASVASALLQAPRKSTATGRLRPTLTRAGHMGPLACELGVDAYIVFFMRWCARARWSSYAQRSEGVRSLPGTDEAIAHASCKPALMPTAARISNVHASCLATNLGFLKIPHENYAKRTCIHKPVK